MKFCHTVIRRSCIFIDDDNVENEIYNEYPDYSDVDVHRYKCNQCGKMYYFSTTARLFFEEGIKSEIEGLQ